VGHPGQGSAAGRQERLRRGLAQARQFADLGGIAKQLAQASELERFDGKRSSSCVPPAARHLAEKSYQEKLRAALQERFGRPVP